MLQVCKYGVIRGELDGAAGILLYCKRACCLTEQLWVVNSTVWLSAVLCCVFYSREGLRARAPGLIHQRRAA